MEVGRKRHTRPLYLSENTQYRLHKRLGGSQVRSGWVTKLLSPRRSDLRNIQLLANSYTNYAVPSDAYRVTLSIFIARQTFTAECKNRFDAGKGGRSVT